MAHSVKRPGPRFPPVNIRQIVGSVLALVLGGIWLWDTVKGVTPPPVINQGIVAALGLLGSGSIKAHP